MSALPKDVDMLSVTVPRPTADFDANWYQAALKRCAAQAEHARNEAQRFRVIVETLTAEKTALEWHLVQAWDDQQAFDGRFSDYQRLTAALGIAERGADEYAARAGKLGKHSTALQRSQAECIRLATARAAQTEQERQYQAQLAQEQADREKVQAQRQAIKDAQDAARRERADAQAAERQGQADAATNWLERLWRGN